MSRMTRRGFLQNSATLCAASLAASAQEVIPGYMPDFPIVDLHVHLDNSTIDAVLPLAEERGVKFGIVEHAGTEENKYPVVLSSDEELGGYLDMLEGKPVYTGVQTEFSDWMGCFSKEMLAKLDYVLTDAMTMPAKDGHRMKLWEKDAEIGEGQEFMDRYVDWHVKIMSEQPVDVLANVSWLPESLAAEYDTLWTEARMLRVIETALKYRVAIEISSGFNLPKLAFLQLAKEAGIKFTFGSNGRYPKMGLLDYSKEMAAVLGLTRENMFTPAPDGQRAVQRRL